VPVGRSSRTRRDHPLGNRARPVATSKFLAAGLVDEIRIHLIDVLLGGGRQLFDQLPQRIEPEQIGLSQTGGMTHLEYRVSR